MLCLSRIPAPPLDAWIDRLWWLGDAPPHARERILPSGTLELVINLHEDEIRIYDAARSERCTRYSGAVVSGAFGAPFVVDTREHRSIMGVHFRPGGAFPFLRLPLGELAGAHVDLEALWGPEARRLRERLGETEAPDERFRRLEEALRDRLARHPGRRDAVAFALGRLGRAAGGVEDIVACTRLSHRRFIEIFEAEVGLTPKLFARVLRFQRALALAGRAAAPSWTDIAHACGYFDQSHLIRDFGAFSGLTPTQYLEQRSERVKENHVPLAGEGSIPSKRRPRTGP